VLRALRSLSPTGPRGSSRGATGRWAATVPAEELVIRSLSSKIDSVGCSFVSHLGIQART
jgi:hypothetical protein